MEKLFSTYSVSEIIIFLIMLALAIKGLVTFFDWAYARLKKAFSHQQEEENKEEQIALHFQKNEEAINRLIENQANFQEGFKKLTDKVDMLISSDMDSIKSYLTEKHHYFCYQQKWIDDYNLECCEKRYNHYTEEGGNSFIANFMCDLRELPNQPPQ